MDIRKKGKKRHRTVELALRNASSEEIITELLIMGGRDR
jgi:hypothetical protein